MSIELSTAYKPSEFESSVAQKWAAASAFAGDASKGGPSYSIVIPPPNVTAALHMGHALNNTIQDILIRHHRMAGFNTAWLPGTDHAGIATQTVVEKRVMQSEGKKRTDFTRDEFVSKIQDWKDEYEKVITGQLKAMGCSCDWDRQAFTLDAPRTKSVRESFFKLFQDDLIYRGKRLVNWDPITQTALADDEVEMEDVKGFFWYMQYPVCDQDGNLNGDHVTVATTRPETMLGDTAVAMNPKDPRFDQFQGKFIKLPIVGRVIPIVGDDYVVLPDPNSDDAKAQYASGFLKVTPAHDPNDYLIGQRHQLPVINVMAKDASISIKDGWDEIEPQINENKTLKQFLGLSREDARKAIVAYFKENNLLEEVKDYTHAVGHSYRSHVPVEPYLSDQWYVKVTSDKLAGAALRAMDKSQRHETDGCVWKDTPSFQGDTDEKATGIKFTPARYSKTFQLWHENIRDWCISRQLWWGHRIPVWHFENHDAVDSKSDTDLTALMEQIVSYQKRDRLAIQLGNDENGNPSSDLMDAFICVRLGDDQEVIDTLAQLGFVQDEDVLDTWFSSALFPMSTLNWPEESKDLDLWNPSSVLCTAREIITLWVSRMTMFNVYFRNCIPFTNVFIHAMIQDGQGQKMSKSLGNGVDPLDIIYSHGSDAMRYTLAQMTTATQDVKMSVDMICPHTGDTFEPKMIKTKAGHKVAAPIQSSPKDKSKKMVSAYGVAMGIETATDDQPLARNSSSRFDLGRNFTNKLWNAARFSLMNLEEAKQKNIGKEQELGLADKWILSRLSRVVNGVNTCIEKYEFSNYAQLVYDFFWRDLCDWYIEVVKPSIQENKTQQNVLSLCLDVALRVMHPIMPFVTETLWEKLNDVASERFNTKIQGVEVSPSNLLVTAAWPKLDIALQDETVESDFEKIGQFITAIRQIRTQQQVPPRQIVEATVDVDPETASLLTRGHDLIKTLANTNIGDAAQGKEKPAGAAQAVVGQSKIFLHDLVDADAEKIRLAKRLEEVTKSVAALQARLANKSYVDRAPEKLVNETKQQLANAEQEKTMLETDIAAL